MTETKTPPNCAHDAHDFNVGVGIHVNDFGRGPLNLIYVVMSNKEAFDLISLPEGGNDNVRHKAIEAANTHIVFQFWPKPVEQAVTA